MPHRHGPSYSENGSAVSSGSRAVGCLWRAAADRHRAGDAFGWANNLLGRIGYVLAPALVGFSSLWIGLGNAMAVSMIFPLIALVIILTTLPETSGRELEDTSSLGH